MSILVTALVLSPVRLIAYDLQINHLHMLLIPINSEDVPEFVGYIQQELAHVVNRLRGGGESIPSGVKDMIRQ